MADRLGRKLSINVAVVIFVVGSAIQCAAVNIPMLFVGRFGSLRGDVQGKLLTRTGKVARLQGWLSVN